MSTCSTSLQNPDVCAALQPVDCNFSHSLTHFNTEYLFYIPPKPGRVITIAASGLQLLSLTHLNTEYLFYIPPKPGRVISIAASGL
ncbi:hypothetical protein Pmani_000572 [Petrolisthes manimaculis]|uniref:Uncharacterized protein n=1 Tax=Petrolisthes manimaculis TaxID=1843537 RepID=A0AAE1QLF3_9EUCA|nr:hypothetical protein Pmani_000572 [Petrolisthes manimaculis]